MCAGSKREQKWKFGNKADGSRFSWKKVNSQVLTRRKQVQGTCASLPGAHLLCESQVQNTLGVPAHHKSLACQTQSTTELTFSNQTHTHIYTDLCLWTQRLVDPGILLDSKRHTRLVPVLSCILTHKGVPRNSTNTPDSGFSCSFGENNVSSSCEGSFKSELSLGSWCWSRMWRWCWNPECAPSRRRVRCSPYGTSSPRCNRGRN